MQKSRALTFPINGGDMFSVHESSSLTTFRASLESDIMTPITHHFNQRFSSPVSEPNTCRVLHKSLRALNAVLKELSHIKMMTSVKTMGQARIPLTLSLLLTNCAVVLAYRSHSRPTFRNICSTNQRARTIHHYLKSRLSPNS